MTSAERAHDLLRRRGMHPELLDIDAVSSDFSAAMKAGVRGEPSSLGMFPAYLTDSGRLSAGRVLVIDAGGTNLRLARLLFTPEKGLVIEQVERSPMPGTSGESIDREQFFDILAERLLPLLSDCDRGCFCFSYPCEILPDGDGRVVRLTKELKIDGLPGSSLCAPLEEALVRHGAKGHRRWHVVNDTVSTMLSFPALSSGETYDETIGFILGTGANICCNVDCREITKSPAAAALSGAMIVNLESGGFDGFPRGDADRLLDESSDASGQQLGEKIISGGYFPALLRRTLELACEDGAVGKSVGKLLRSGLEFTMADVGVLCTDGQPDFLPGVPEEDLNVIREITALLLDRGARLLCAELSTIIGSRHLASGSRVCVCADGTTFAKNPLLQPLTKQYLRSCVTERSGITVDFFQAQDATLMGTAYAAMLG